MDRDRAQRKVSNLHHHLCAWTINPTGLFGRDRRTQLDNGGRGAIGTDAETVWATSALETRGDQSIITVPVERVSSAPFIFEIKLRRKADQEGDKR